MRPPSRFSPIMLLLLCFVGACSSPDKPFRFEVLLEDSGDLVTNSPVRTGEEELGKIVKLERTEDGDLLTLELESRYRGRLSRRARFEVVSAPTGVQLTVLNAFGGPSIEDGSRIDARPDWLEKLTRRLDNWEDKTRDFFRDAGSTLQEFTRDLSQSPEARALLESIDEFGQDLATVTRDRYQKFLDEKLPKLEERARKHRQELIAEGREKEAEIFWKWFERWANAMRGGALNEPAEAEENPPPG